MTRARGARIEHFAFDSRTLPEGDRFARYRDIYGGGADIVATGPAMEAIVDGWRFDHVLLFHRRLNDVAHIRDHDRVVGDGLDHLSLTMVKAGEFAVGSGAGARPVRPGEGIVLSMQRPSRYIAHHAEIVTVSMARRRAPALVEAVNDLHGHVLDGAATSLLAAFAATLLPTLDIMSMQAGAAAASVIIMLLTAALEEQGAVILTGERTADHGRFDAVRGLVETRLDDPAFNVAAITAESGLSRATLYRLFERHGGVGSFLRSRRLERIRVDLSRAGEDRPFAAIAFAAGFVSESHASRAFHERYGVRPGDLRTMMTEGGGQGASIRRMRAWIDELR